MNSILTNVLDRVNLVVFQTRIITPIRDTGEGKKDGSRIEKVLQSCFDPASLRPLSSKKQEATRICRNYGTKIETLNAWAVPIERTQDLLAKLAKIESEWEELAGDLARSIKDKVDDWVTRNPAESTSILSLAPTSHDVSKATKFIYTSFRLRAEDVDDNGCLETELSDLAGQTLYELSVVLRDAKLDTASGDRYRQSVKDVLGRLATKAQSLAFLDSRIAEVAAVLTSTIAMLPVSGVICDAHAVLVKSIIDQLLNPRKLMRDGFAKIEMPAEVASVSPDRKKAQPSSDTEVSSVPLYRSPAALPVQAFSW